MEQQHHKPDYFSSAGATPPRPHRLIKIEKPSHRAPVLNRTLPKTSPSWCWWGLASGTPPNWPSFRGFPSIGQQSCLLERHSWGSFRSIAGWMRRPMKCLEGVVSFLRNPTSGVKPGNVAGESSRVTAAGRFTKCDTAHARACPSSARPCATHNDYIAAAVLPTGLSQRAPGCVGSGLG